MSGTKATGVRTIIIAKTTLAAVHAALELLRNGKGLTNVESGVVTEAALGQSNLVQFAPPYWNGTLHVQFIYVTNN